MKLEVGMYVRTKEGHICKIKSITRSSSLGEETIQARFICENNNIYDYDKYDTSDDIKGKPSHNIIDLIQSKDLIVDTKNNLYVVDRVEGDYVFTTSKNEYGLIITLVDYQIKSIVTKEMFESMSYKVVE